MSRPFNSFSLLTAAGDLARASPGGVSDTIEFLQ
jgi:hypothetical protein